MFLHATISHTVDPSVMAQAATEPSLVNLSNSLNSSVECKGIILNWCLDSTRESVLTEVELCNGDERHCQTVIQAP